MADSSLLPQQGLPQQRLLDVKDLHVDFKVYGGRLQGAGRRQLHHAGRRKGRAGRRDRLRQDDDDEGHPARVCRRRPAEIPAGEILFEGRDVRRMNDSELQRLRGSGISMIFQDPTAALNPVFTVGQQLEAVIQASAGRGGLRSRRDPAARRDLAAGGGAGRSRALAATLPDPAQRRHAPAGLHRAWRSPPGPSCSSPTSRAPRST